MHLKNQSNNYVDALEPGVFDKIPKAVWAAIAISRITMGGDRFASGEATPEVLTQEIMAEWEALKLNGIVPQKPR